MTFSQNERRFVRPGRLITALMAVSLLAACGKGADPNAKVAGANPPAAAVPAAPAAPASPVVAKVNGAALTEAQVNAILNRLGNPSPEQAKEAGKQVLAKLVEQEMVVQAATAQKLDQDPKFVQALDLARRELLANFYLEQVANKAGAKPTEEELKSYFDKNPALFADRRVYIVRELAVQAKPEFKAELEQAMAKEKSLEGVAKWLKSKNIQFAPNSGAHPSEQIAPPLLPKLHDIANGGIVMQEAPAGFLLVQKMDSKPQPVKFEQVKPVVERILVNQKRADAAANELKLLKEKTKIELLGDYAPAAAPAPKPEAAGTAAADKPASAPAPAAAPAAEPAKAGGK